jgi:hypothetical protein
LQIRNPNRYRSKATVAFCNELPLLFDVRQLYHEILAKLHYKKPQ